MSGPSRYPTYPRNDLPAVLNSIADRVAKLETSAKGSQWYDYFPNWTAVTTNPAIGNGSVSGRYARVGQTVHMTAVVVMGSTTTFGSGSWYVDLPFPPATVTAGDMTNNTPRVGSCLCFDSSAGLSYTGVSYLDTSSGVPLAAWVGQGVIRVDATHPITWATSDSLTLSLTYETDQ